MKIIEPSIEFWNQGNNLAEHVGRCARICYRADKRNDEKLTNALWKNNHRSMFRHWTRYFIVPHYHLSKLDRNLYLENNPYLIYYDNNTDIYISTNEQFIRENNRFYNLIVNYEVTEERMFELAKENSVIYNIIRFTFKVTTQISTSRELNRVSPNNIAEQSTRYVYDDGTLCRPHWLHIDEVLICTSDKYTDEIIDTYINGCTQQFNRYTVLVNKGMDKQDARGILPIDTATICAYTYSLSEWKHIIDLRYYGTTGAPHPNAKLIAGMIKDKLNEITGLNI